MIAPRAPGLRLEPSPNGKSLTVYDIRGRSVPIPCRLSESLAAEYRKILKRGLDSLKAIIREGPPSVKVAHAALGELNRVGLTLLWQIFEGQPQVIVGVFQRAFPAWRTAEEPLRISVVAELGRFLPLEFLPLFELSDWPPADDAAALAAAGRRFPGLSAVIQREFRDLSVDQDPVLQNDPKLPVRCFNFTGLEGAGEELRFFETNREVIDLEGPWPTGVIKDFSRSLARHLRYGNRRFDDTERSPADQVQHFACHCDVDKEVSSDSRLRLSSGNEVTIGELQANFAVLTDRQPGSRPLIFLNACGSSRMEPMTVTSFPRFFLHDNRNRGFIGTETNIPDAFAAAFSKSFYEELLAGSSLGKAIYAAKWAMLTKDNNPLGILYTVYANPDLRVSKPVERWGTSAER